jgi:hypothetical protein
VSAPDLSEAERAKVRAFDLDRPEPIVLAPDIQAYITLLAAQMGDRRVNGYHCPSCGRTLIVTHLDEGVTPVFLACRKTAGCTGQSHSLGYPPSPVPAYLGEPTHEWYRPGQEQFDSLDPAMREHVERGGLMLREVGS